MFSRPSASLWMRDAVRRQQLLVVDRAICRALHQRRCVAGGEEIDAVVVGEEDLAGVEPGGRGEGAPARRCGVVGHMRCVARVAGDRVVPAGIPRRRRQHHHLLKLAERHRRVARGVGKRPVGQGRTEGKASRPPPEESRYQRKLQRVIVATGQGRRPGLGQHGVPPCGVPGSKFKVQSSGDVRKLEGWKVRRFQLSNLPTF